MITAVFFIIVAFATSTTSGSDDRVILQRKLQAGRDSNPCELVRCPGDSPVCIVLDNGTAQCIKDPCVDLICNAASTCKVDGDGNGYCHPLPGNPGNEGLCAAVTCPIDSPICVILEDATSDCIKDPCSDEKCEEGNICFLREVHCVTSPCHPVAECIKDPCVDLICNAASTCKVDGDGNGYCHPLPGNPGNEGPCAAVTCPIEAPICTLVADGTAECSSAEMTPINIVNSDGKPQWWDNVKENFRGKNISRCKKLKNVAPLTGTACTQQKKEKAKSKQKRKTCFFGNQECDGVGPYPDTKCVCTKGEWTCNSSLTCPT